MVFESDSCPQISVKKGFHKLSNLRSVALSAIKFEDETFRITANAEISNLAASIKQLCLIHSPVVKQHRSEYIIISGFRRIAACRKIGWSEIPVHVLSSETGNETCTLLAIADNSLQRRLNLLEISRSLYLLSRYVEDPNLLLTHASNLGLPCHRDHVEKVIKICQMPVSIQDAVRTGSIALPIALDLSKIDAAVGTELVKLFVYLKIGFNKQRELISLLNEISKRENISLQALLAEKDLQKILANKELDRPQMGQQLKEVLTRRRFPTIFKTKAEFVRIIKALKLSENISLIPPKDFEGTSYKLTLQFKSHSELQEMQSKLETIIRNPNLKNFLES